MCWDRVIEAEAKKSEQAQAQRPSKLVERPEFPEIPEAPALAEAAR